MSANWTESLLKLFYFTFFQICVCFPALDCSVIILSYVTGHLLLLSPEKMEPRHGIMKAFSKVKRAKVLQGKDAPPLKKTADDCDVTGGYSVCTHASTLQKEWFIYLFIF